MCTVAERRTQYFVQKKSEIVTEPLVALEASTAAESDTKEESPTPIKLSHSDMFDFQSVLGLSDNATLRLAQMLREKFNDKTLIFPNLRPAMRARNLVFEDLFEQCEFHGHPAVFCTDCIALIGRVAAERRDDEANIDMVKVSVDGGRGSLKVSINILWKDSRNSASGPRGRRYFRDSGVKTSFVLGIVPAVKETYAILCDLLQHVSLPRKWVLVGDLKVINLVLGLQSHGSMHPCAYCNWRRGGAENSMDHLEHRTFEGIKANSDAYRARYADPSAASSRRHLHDFFNCEFCPIDGIFPSSGRVIDFIPLSELHLLLGVVNKLFDEFSAYKNCTGICALWNTSLHVSRSAFRNEFNGNDCALIISDVGVSCLKDLIASASGTVSSRVYRRKRSRTQTPAEKFLATFRAFGRLVSGIFGANLSPDWSDRIREFCDAYLALGISVTPKVHIIFVHLREWMRMMRVSAASLNKQVKPSMILIKDGVISRCVFKNGRLIFL